MSGYLTCSNCGKENELNATFCADCGWRLAAGPSSYGQQPPYGQPAGVSYHQAPPRPDSDYSYVNYGYKNPYDPVEDAYIVTNIPYYKEKFAKMRMADDKVTWNWPAFLFSPFWFIYRKMYAWGFAILAADIFLNIVGGSLIMAILCGIFGNYFYMKRVHGYAELNRRLQSEGERQAHSQKYGGTNSAAVVLIIIGYIIVTSLLTWFVLLPLTWNILSDWLPELGPFWISNSWPW